MTNYKINKLAIKLAIHCTIATYIVTDSYHVIWLYICMIQKATVRKLFREVRKKFGAKTAIQLFRVTLSIHPETKKERIETENEIRKSDDQICNVGISNGARLRIQIHPSNREVYTIFVTLPNGVNKTFLLQEVHSYVVATIVTEIFTYACMHVMRYFIMCVARKY